MTAVTEDKGPEVLGVIISMLALGGIFIFARTYTRTIIKPGFGWDDILIIITWFIILGYAIAMCIAVHRGYGHPLSSMSFAQYSRLVHAEIIGQVFAIASFPTGKASVAVFLTRLFPGKRLFWSVWILVALNTCFFYIDAILIVVQCAPAAYQWDRTIEGGHCWNPEIVTNFGIATGAVGALADFVFAIIPWFYIWNLQMKTRERVVVGVALSLGFFAGICSILKIYYTGRLTSRSDYAFDTIPLVQWSCVELAFINVAACIPTLRPLYRAIKGEKDSSTSKSSSYAKGSGHFSRRRAGHSELESGTDDRNIYATKTYGYTYEMRTASPEEQAGTEVRGGRGSDDARLITR